LLQCRYRIGLAEVRPTTLLGALVSSDAALSGSWVAYKPVVLKLPSTVGFYKLPEWAGSRIGCGEGRIFKS